MEELNDYLITTSESLLAKWKELERIGEPEAQGLVAATHFTATLVGQSKGFYDKTQEALKSAKALATEAHRMKDKAKDALASAEKKATETQEKAVRRADNYATQKKDEANQLKSSAENDAATIKENSQREAIKLREEIQKACDLLKKNTKSNAITLAQEKANELLRNCNTRIESLEQTAHHDAEVIRQTARQNAQVIRQTAQQNAQLIRQTAREDAEGYLANVRNIQHQAQVTSSDISSKQQEFDQLFDEAQTMVDSEKRRTNDIDNLIGSFKTLQPYIPTMDSLKADKESFRSNVKNLEESLKTAQNQASSQKKDNDKLQEKADQLTASNQTQSQSLKACNMLKLQIISLQEEKATLLRTVTEVTRQRDKAIANRRTAEQQIFNT